MAARNQGARAASVDLATGIVAAYVSHNAIAADQVPSLVTAMHDAIVDLKKDRATSGSTVAPRADKQSTDSIRASVRPYGLVSFLDGKTYKTLKRHLTANGLDPQSYRQRFGLPADYPMVASDYAARRSALAKQIGLGRAARTAEVRNARFA